MGDIDYLPQSPARMEFGAIFAARYLESIQAHNSLLDWIKHKRGKFGTRMQSFVRANTSLYYETRNFFEPMGAERDLCKKCEKWLNTTTYRENVENARFGINLFIQYRKILVDRKIVVKS